MLSVELLPALFGDAIWIEWGPPGDLRRMLIDCGTKSTYRVVRERIQTAPVDLFVLTHIDSDHISGAVPLLGEFNGDYIKEVWFNGHRQLRSAADTLGGLEAEAFDAMLADPNKHYVHNGAFSGNAIGLASDGGLWEYAPDDWHGLRLTVLSPTLEQLTSVLEVWNDEVRAEHLTPGLVETGLEIIENRPSLEPDAVAPDALGDSTIDVPALATSSFKEDSKAPNGSSIALLLEYGGHAVLLAADAWPTVLVEGLERLLAQRGIPKLPLSAFKVSHHGSDHNTDGRLLQLIDCKHFLFSTNSKRFKTHPGLETISRIIDTQDEPTLYFNYRTPRNEVWDDDVLRDEYRFETVYPPGKPGFVEWKA